MIVYANFIVVILVLRETGCPIPGLRHAVISYRQRYREDAYLDTVTQG